MRGSILVVLGAVLSLSPVRALADGADDATLKLFRSKCASCHGVDGKGQTTAGKKLNVKDWTDGVTLAKFTDEKLAAVIREGVKGDDGKVKMKPLNSLTPEQNAELVKLVRALGKGK